MKQTGAAMLEIIGAIRQAGSWIIIRITKPPAPRMFYVDYAGVQWHFETLEQLNAFTRRRWNKVFTFNGGI